MPSIMIPDVIVVPEPGYARRVTWLVALALGAIVAGATLAFVVDETASSPAQVSANR